MKDSYKTLEKPAEGIFKDRNSRFLAFGFPVETADQVNEIIRDIRKKYHDARHHCYAYRIGYGGEMYRMNDDGEPSGTAGKPIHNQLVSHELTNALIVVVRYFGGTLLGTGGLINAYKMAAGDMIGKASIVVRYVEVQYRLSFAYDKLNAVMKVLKDGNVRTDSQEFDEQCTMIISVRKSMVTQVIEKLLKIESLSIG